MSSRKLFGEQLSLLDLPLLEETFEPPPVPMPLNLSALAWQKTKESFYLKLMNRFMTGRLCAQAVRSHEITRLHQLRQQALAEIKRMEGRP